MNPTPRTFTDSVLDAVNREMAEDQRVFYMATSPPPALTAAFGPARVRRTPIAESAMTGMAIGAAGSGYRPIVNWGNVTFSLVAFDQIVNQAARIRYMFGGQRDFPIVFQASFLNGTRSAAQHSQSGFALYAHAAGLKVVAPSDPADAGALMRAAIRDDNPVVFLYADLVGAVEGPVADDAEVARLGEAHVVRTGTDVTVVGVGRMTRTACAAADRLARSRVSAEVIDLRSVVPLDAGTIRSSVRRTGRLVVVDESFPTCSVAAEIQSLVVEDGETFRALRAPAIRVCTAPVPIPFSPPLEDRVLPDTDDVVDAVTRLIQEEERAHGTV